MYTNNTYIWANIQICSSLYRMAIWISISGMFLSTKQISVPYTIPLWTSSSLWPLNVGPQMKYEPAGQKWIFHRLKALYDYQGTKNELKSHPAKCHRSIFKLASLLLSLQSLACGLYLLTCLSGKLLHSNWTQDSWLQLVFPYQWQQKQTCFVKGVKCCKLAPYPNEMCLFWGSFLWYTNS